MDIIQSNEAFKWVDDKFRFQYVQGFIRSEDGLFVAKWKNRQGPPIDLYDQRRVVTEDRGPMMQPDWTVAEGQDHHIKTPSLHSYANEANLEELLRREVETCEILRRHPHPNIAQYLGCLETRGRVSGLCFEKHAHSLASTVNPGHLNKAEFLRSGRQFVNDDMRQKFEGLKAAVDYLHSLDLVHNDITPANVMFNEDGEMLLIDFDSCRWLGEDLRSEAGAGTKRTHAWHDPEVTVSSKKNDIDAIAELGTWLFGVSAEDFLFRG